MNKEILLSNINKIHTTELGKERIKKNLNINKDVVEYCKNKIKDNNCNIYKQGKNYYCEIDNIKITINSYNYSIITVHKINKKTKKIYKIKTDSFLLEIEPIYNKEDQSYPVNTNLIISLNCFNFSVKKLKIDINIIDLKQFIIDLKNIYDTLQGKALLKETYGKNYIEFSINKNGHIEIKGCLNSGMDYGFNQELNFTNEIDQTNIKGFIEELENDYLK